MAEKKKRVMNQSSKSSGSKKHKVIVMMVVMAIIIVVAMAAPRSLVVNGLAGLGLASPASPSNLSNPSSPVSGPTANVMASKRNSARPAASNSGNQSPLHGTQPILIVEATPSGFDPEEMNITAGDKVLIIRNRTGLDNRSFMVSSPGNSPEKVITLLGQDVEMTKRPFTPGEVVVSDVNNPSFTCRITVTP